MQYTQAYDNINIDINTISNIYLKAMYKNLFFVHLFKSLSLNFDFWILVDNRSVEIT